MSKQKIIFLDIETNSLTPQSNAIIEVAAVSVIWDKMSGNLELCDHFSSLVNIEQELEEVVVKLTGIEQSELEGQPTTPQAQQKWQDWMNKELDGWDKVVLSGHSASTFDINFLKKGGWFLPESFEVLDTLIITKILLPTLKVINLENLITVLGLEKHFNPFIANIPDLQPHRALYDSFACFSLVNHFVKVLENLDLPKSFLEKFEKNFWYLDLDFIKLGAKSLSQIELKKVDDGDISREKILIDWAGNKMPTHYNKLVNNPSSAKDIELLSEVIKTSESKAFLLQVYCQLFVIKWWKNREAGYSLNLHGNGMEQKMGSIILSRLTDVEAEVKESVTYVLPTLESLSWMAGVASEESVAWERLVSPITVMQGFFEEFGSDDLAQAGVEIAKATLLLLNAYDYLMIALQPYWHLAKMDYNPSTFTLNKEKVVEKFGSLLQEVRDWERIVTENKFWWQSRLDIKPLIEFCLDFVAKINLDSRGIYTFYLSKNYLRISKIKPQFSLQTHFEDLLEKFERLELPTFLERDDVGDYLNLIGLHNIRERVTEVVATKTIEPNLTVYHHPLFTDNSITKSLESLLPRVGASGKSLLVMAGSNSSFKMCEYIIREKMDRGGVDYLIMGLSGSLTKIFGKLNQGFTGIILLNQKDIWLMHTLAKSPKFCTAILVDNWAFQVPALFKSRNMKKNVFQPFLAKSLIRQLQYLDNKND